MDDLKRRLELLLGAKPEATGREQPTSSDAQQAPPNTDRKQRVAEAGGQLVAATLRLLSELVPRAEDPSDTPTSNAVREQLASVLNTDPTGRPVLTLTLPDQSAIDNIARCWEAYSHV